MPLIRKWKRLSLVWQLTIALCVSLIIIGALVIAVIGLATAQSAVKCVNNTLGHRNEPSARDAEAHIDFAIASKIYDAATLAALTGAPGPELKATFIEAARFKNAADDKYATTLAADQKLRDATPLGHCG